ncbi:2-succinyl-5-enolpyruvyl-6-hydroxy-3-cyclohexene-1-carboxylate synthase [Algoriphagus ratkowskyi]|uniref:2-succinyl-5-enolpyruvyl-6-hydroxy-3-cyclohexene-1-carboxylate synthase n=1 Tax=Algoriphagus ratkowskyi TaxID=57028 RepID=A0A2W7S1T0_9BACT|nr:2-succinyl-5-enolpyruvyl-6-hydroxy-3-cyclohexene-1-carboxylic-acid synthase [Algoriphagus ratkowskyi]PZX61307.1 2-succinyl-5-enolpyruvyl-6-hydroxy-3-cyclohexene-1-carboxylate synthase [Algoriphagus ratkowskyi]TXD79415.1 2-succinyl-5-enolpyruvyl-6-hydroxy-3-cyclohexene-1-carboxylic-acid synthase [Algoriphagus ratkowskyi]
MILTQITELVAICAKKGISNVILSPGSRCAPLTLAFARHPDIHARSISDERSAAFIAMGIAQQLEQPVALVCTSGSAALNYFPAIAEAFFQQIPLLILTADRPSEWIDQYDGQTIFQPDVYGKHVKGSFQFPDSSSNPDQLWHSSRIVNEAINLANQFPAGPVHINIPLREPFYPEVNEQLVFPEKPRVFSVLKSKTIPTDESLVQFKNRLEIVQKIVIISGQQRPNAQLQILVDNLSKDLNVVIVTDTISNLQSDQTINLHDHWLGNEAISEELKPDLIISFGKSVISKSLKLFLRKTQASHWHVQPDGMAKDTFLRLTRNIGTSPAFFLHWLNQNLGVQNADYYQAWHTLEKSVAENLPQILNKETFGEYSALAFCLSQTPSHSKIHVANSMAVRYLNLLGKRNQEVICNRGTSGIDGSNSTAVGCTFTTKEIVTLITGDMAFFYDRNAFWHNYTFANLRIILLNNHAGGIFRLIDGPKNQPELEEYFETRQNLTAQHLATEFGFFYSKVVNQEELEASLEDFYEDSLHSKILEIETSSPLNAEILKSVKEKIKTAIQRQ